jgi:hypothetical protein
MMRSHNSLRKATAAALLFLAVNFINAQALSVSITGQTNVSCNGMCNGSVTALAAGGTGGPYTYAWNPGGAATASVTGLCAGNYTVTVNDGVSTATVSATLTQPAVLSVGVNSQSMCQGGNVSLCANVTGGVLPYTFNWSPGSSLSSSVISCPQASPTTTTSYTVTVSDANACVATGSATVNVFSNPVPAASNTGPYCPGSTIQLNCTSVGITYSWVGPNGFSSTAQNPTIPSAATANAGTYTVSVTSAQGCVGAATTTVTVNANPTVTFSPTSPVCDGTSASLCPGISPPGTYTWTWNGACGYTSGLQCPPPIPMSILCSPMSFSVTATDVNGCVGSAVGSVTVAPNPIASVLSYVEPSCAGSNGTMTVTATGGSGPYLHQLSDGQSGGSGIFGGLLAVTYTATVTDNNGCNGAVAFYMADSCEVVWPGDADNDLTANNFDILDIGLYYGNTGMPRNLQGNSWSPHPAINFANTKPNGFNEKHDDCNGDGLIDASDTTAVIQNYNYIHPPYKLAMSSVMGTPLTLEFSQDTVSNNGTAQVRIMLGHGSSPANNIYGLALTLSIDTTIVEKDSTTIDVSSSWLAAGSPVFLNNVIENYPNAEVDIALCRTDHANVSGNGEVASVSMTMKDDISGKIMNGVTKTLQINITKAKLIGMNGDTISYTATGDSLVVDQLSTSSLPVKIVSQVKLYPNPAHDFTLLTSTTSNLLKAEVYSLQGKKVEELKNEQAAKEIMISTKNMEKGIYLMKVFTTEGIKIFRLQVN